MNTYTGLLTNHCGLQVYIYRSRNMTPRAPNVEESVERLLTRVRFCQVVQEDPIRPDAVLKAEKLPAGISCLDTCLPHMNRDALPLKRTIQAEVKMPQSS